MSLALHVRDLWRYTVAEPLRVAVNYLPQVLITSASVYLVAGFGASHNILPPPVAYAMAVGFEWTLLRGWATAATLRGDTPWEVWGLNLTAFLTVVTYGILYILGLPAVGVIPTVPGKEWGIVLAVAKVVPLALMTFFAMMLHRAAAVQEGAREDAYEAERKRLELADYQARLKDQRDVERLRLKRGLTASPGVIEPTVTTPSHERHAASQSARDVFKAAVKDAYRDDPQFNRTRVASAHGWSRPAVNVMLEELRNEGEI